VVTRSRNSGSRLARDTCFQSRTSNIRTPRGPNPVSLRARRAQPQKRRTVASKAVHSASKAKIPKNRTISRVHLQRMALGERVIGPYIWWLICNTTTTYSRL
jgi:hypothetical protein